MAHHFGNNASPVSDLVRFNDYAFDETTLDSQTFLPGQEWDAQYHGSLAQIQIQRDNAKLPDSPYLTRILRPDSKEDWASQRANITKLCSEEGKTLKKVAEIMERDFRFVAT